MALAGSVNAQSVFREFVTVHGDQLLENGRPFRFISFNIPNLHLVEDNTVFDGDNAWRWPDRFEITDALESVRQQGGQVARPYVLSVIRTNDAPGVPRHVAGPVAIKHAVRFDELADLSLLHQQQGSLEIKNRDRRKAKEDAHRLGGQSGSAIVYRVSGPVHPDIAGRDRLRLRPTGVEQTQVSACRGGMYRLL